MLRYTSSLKSPRAAGEHEKRLSTLLSNVHRALQAATDGKIPETHQGTAIRAMLSWMEEASIYGGEILEAVTHLGMEEEIEEHDAALEPDPEPDDVSPEPGDEQAPKDEWMEVWEFELHTHA